MSLEVTSWAIWSSMAAIRLVIAPFELLGSSTGGVVTGPKLGGTTLEVNYIALTLFLLYNSLHTAILLHNIYS